ncbi:MAG TPA: hypothetical protein VIG94_10420 [Faecalibacter sp.]
MRKKITANIALIYSLTVILSGCSMTEKVPDGEYLFVKNKFEYDQDDPDIKKKQKIVGEDLSSYVKQKPAGKFLGFFPLWQWVYNWAPAKFDQTFEEYYREDQSKRNQKLLDSLLVKNGLEEFVGKSLIKERFFYRSGEAPVLLDEDLSEFSAENLNRLFHDKGYFDSKVSVQYDKNDKAKKAKTIYQIKLGEPSYIETVSNKIYDKDIEDLLTVDRDQFDGINLFGKRKTIKTNYMKESKVVAGDQYDFSKFEAERDRIVDLLKNRGYYDFNDSGEDLYFEADTLKSNKRLDVTLFIDKFIQDTIVKDSTKQFLKYNWGNINIYTDARNTNDINFDSIQKIEHNGYNVYYKGEPKYKPRYYTDAFVLRPNQLFRQRQEIQTKRNIFKRENINLHKFDIIKRDSLLDVNVYFTPKKKYDLNVFFESYASQYMNFAISPGVTLTTRNLFGGGENLETTLKGNLGSVDKDFTDSDRFLNAYELALEARLKFPYLLAPKFMEDWIPRRFVSESAIRLNTSTQKNVGLDRVSYGFGLDMDMTSGEFQHKISLFNTEFVDNSKKDRYYTIFKADNERKDLIVENYFNYDNTLRNEYEGGLITDDEITDIIQNDQGYRQSLTGQDAKNYVDFEDMLYRKASISQNVLINSFIYQFTYNQENGFRPVPNPWFGSARIELAGNLLRALDKAFGFNRGQNELNQDTGLVFGIPYSQFVKFDFEVRKKWTISPQAQFATRGFFGIIKPYGNTDITPFVRSYSAGGANDVRGWWPLTLGPADRIHIEGVNRESLAFESLKLLFNAEYRYRMTDMFEVATFLDAGNIWSVSKDREQYQFKFNKFYKQFGVGTGVGLRIHISNFAIVRFDLGYKLYDPSYDEGDRWQLDNFNILKPRLHFGINYPF